MREIGEGMDEMLADDREHLPVLVGNIAQLSIGSLTCDATLTRPTIIVTQASLYFLGASTRL